MIPPLDVLVLRKQEPVWLGCAETLVSALELGRKNGTGRYLVFSHEMGHKTLYVVNTEGAVRPVTSFEDEFVQYRASSERVSPRKLGGRAITERRLRDSVTPTFDSLPGTLAFALHRRYASS
jgi:hypothetical protein